MKNAKQTEMKIEDKNIIKENNNKKKLFGPGGFFRREVGSEIAEFLN